MAFLNKFRRNNFLVIYVKADGLKFPILIPVSVYALEDVLDSIVQLLRVVLWFIPGKKIQCSISGWKDQKITVLSKEQLDTVLDMIHEFRRLGPFTLVEVNDREAHVSIKLY